MNLKKSISVLSIVFCIIYLFMGKLNAQTPPIQILLRVMPPYPVQLEAYEDKLIIDLINASAETHYLNFRLNIFGPNGLSLQTDNLLSGDPLIMGPGESRAFIGDEVEELEFDIIEEDIEYGDYSADEIADFKFRRILPEGEYQVCLVAFDALNPDLILSNEAGGACSDFSIIYADRPIIEFPLQSSHLDPNTLDLINVIWTDPAVLSFSNYGIEIEYTLKLVDLEDYGYDSDLEALFDPGTAVAAEAVIIEEGIPITSFQLEDLLLDEGHRYALRITAEDLSNQIAYQFGGHSEIVSFTWGSDCDELDSYAISAAFPLQGDTLPFVGFPCIAKFNPYCDDYLVFGFDTEIFEEGSDYYDRPHDINNWRAHGGALPYLQTRFSDATEEHAAHLPLTKPWNYPHPFIRGKSYSWQAETTMEDAFRHVHHSDIELEEFHIGMTRPQQTDPPNGSRKERGEIPLSWITGRAPEKILPPFSTMHTHGVSGPVEFDFISNIDEKYVVQISRSEDFATVDTVVSSGKLEYATEDEALEGATFYPERLIPEIYKELSSSVVARDTGYYFWRILYLNDPNHPGDDLYTLGEEEYYRSSPIWNFYITDEEITPGEDPEPEETVCDTGCELDPLTNIIPISNLDGVETVRVGHFTMSDIEISSHSGLGFTGKAIIEIPFLNDVRIKVEFEDIRINTDHAVYEGIVRAEQDTTAFTITDIHSSLGTIASLAPSQVDDFNEYIEEGRVVTAFTSGREIGMPIGFDRTIKGVSLLMGIVEMTFEPQRAHTKLLFNLHFDKLDFLDSDDEEENWISLGASNVCLKPSGFGKEYILHMNEDLSFPTRDDTYIVVKGAGDDAADIRENATYVEIDCEGLLGFAIRVEVHFSRSSIVPDTEDGTPGDGQVKGYFGIAMLKDRAGEDSPESDESEDSEDSEEETTLDLRENNWMAHFNMDPFQIEGLEGWGFRVEEGWIDVSDVENPAELEFPEGYEHAAIDAGDARLTNTWKGFYLKHLALVTPGKFAKDGMRREIGIRDMILDPKLTANLTVKNVYSTEEGEIDGWAFSIDTFHLQLVQNHFREGGMDGKIGMPVMEEGEFLDYESIVSRDAETIGEEDGAFNFIFHVKPTDVITIPAIIAQVEIYEDTYFNIIYADRDPSEGRADRGFLVEGRLNGKANINDDYQPSELFSRFPGTFNIPGVEFRFNFHSRDGISDEHFGLASPQKRMSNFPVNIKDFDLDWNPSSDGDELIFTIEPEIVLMGGTNGFTGSSIIHFDSKINRDTRRFKMEGVRVSGVHVHGEISQVILDGELEFYNTRSADDVGDKGIKGALTVTLPTEITVELAAEFGARVINPSAEHGTAENFNYWYVDGMVNIGSRGIPISAGFGLYGLGGGVYFNMSPINPTNDDIAAKAREINEQPEASFSDGNRVLNPIIRSGFRPNIQFDQFYIKFAATMGTYPNPEAFNMDVAFGAEFTPRRGLNRLDIDGKGYVMTELDERDDSRIFANVHMDYTKTGEKKEFGGFVDVYVNIENKIKGATRTTEGDLAITANFYADNYGGSDGKGEWYFHIGHVVAPRCSLEVNMGPLEASAGGYFMVGHRIPTDLPPLPDAIAELIGKSNSSERGRLTEAEFIESGTGLRRNNHDDFRYKNATGFAFGTHLHADNIPLVDVVFIYATLGVDLGLDINMTRDLSRVCYNGEDGASVIPGKNGWYAQGQVYAGIHGDIGLKVKLFRERKISLFKLGAAVMLQGGLPNPEWFEGRLAVYYSVLRGAFRGTARFNVSIGERCIPRSGDAFQGISFIAETLPVNGERNVDVFTNPQVSFHLPVNEIMELPYISSDGDVQIDRLEPFLHEFSVKEQRGTAFGGHVQLSSDKITVEFNKEEPFQGIEGEGTAPAYEMNIVIRARDHNRGGALVRQEGSSIPWQEDSLVVFTTGMMPDSIPPDLVKYSNPIEFQRFFIQGESSNQEGVLVFKINLKRQYFYEEKEGKNYDYMARFSGLDGSEARDVAIPNSTIYSNSLKFSMPGDLSPETIYSLQIIRKERSSREDDGLVLTGPIGGLPGMGSESIGAMIMAGELRVDEALFSDLYNEYSFYSRARKLVPGTSVAYDETQLYKIYFKTSAFNTLLEKLNGVSTHTELSLDFEFYEYPYVFVNSHEGFDRFDMLGLVEKGVQILPPRIRLVDPFDANYHQNKVRPLIGDFTSEYRQELFGNPQLMNIPFEFSNTVGSLAVNASGTVRSLYGRLNYLLEFGGSSHSGVVNGIPKLTLPQNLFISWWGTGTLVNELNHQVIRGILPPLSSTEIQTAWDATITDMMESDSSSGTDGIAGTIGSGIIGGGVGIPAGIDPSSIAHRLKVKFDTHDKVQRDAHVLRDWGGSVLSYRIRIPLASGLAYVNGPTIYASKLMADYPDFYSHYWNLFADLNQLSANRNHGNYNLLFSYNNSLRSRQYTGSERRVNFSY